MVMVHSDPAYSPVFVQPHFCNSEFSVFFNIRKFPQKILPLTSYVFIGVIPEAVVNQNKSPPVIPVPYTPKSKGEKKECLCN